MEKRRGDERVRVRGDVDEGDVLLRGDGRNRLGLLVHSPQDVGGRLAQRRAGMHVVFGGVGVFHERGRDALDAFIQTARVFPDFREGVRGAAADDVLEAPRAERHADLRFGGERDDVARVLLGPALQRLVVSLLRGEFGVLVEHPGPQFFIQRVVAGVLGLYRPHEQALHARCFDFLRNHEIVFQQDVALALLRVGEEPELLDLLHRVAAHADDVDVEARVLGHGTVPVAEDDGLVALSRLFHLKARDGAKLVDGPRVPADARVGRADGLGRQVVAFEKIGGPALELRRLRAQFGLAHGVEAAFLPAAGGGLDDLFFHLAENVDVDVVTGENDAHVKGRFPSGGRCFRFIEFLEAPL